MHTITVNSLLPYKPCQTGWDNFLKVFNNPAPDQPISIIELLDAGIPVADVIWALRGLPETSLLQIKAFAIECAESVLPVFEKRFPDDKRPRTAIETAKRFLKGEATLSELLLAQGGAADADADAAAAYAAADADAAAAYAAADADAAAAAAYAAATAAAYDSSYAATAAAYAAATAAAYDSSYAAERAKQAEYLRKHFPE